MRSRTPALGICVVVLVLAVSCGVETNPTDDVTRLLQGSEDDLQRSEEQNLLRQEFVRDCMAAFGFQYIPYVPGPDPYAPMRGRAAVLAGTDEDFAKRHGYGLTVGILDLGHRALAQDPNRAIRQAGDDEDGDAWDRAFERCNRDAWEAMGIDLVDLSDALSERSQAVRDLDSRILSDERVVSATKTWATCMREHGYDYSTIVDPVEEVRRIVHDASDRLALDEPSLSEFDAVIAQVEAIEVEIAQADIECRSASGLARTLAQVRAETEKVFIEETRGLFERLDRILAGDQS